MSRSAEIGAILDEHVIEHATDPRFGGYFVSTRSGLSGEREWVVEDDGFSRRVLRPLVADLWERVVSRSLVPLEWIDDPSRRFADRDCNECEGLGALEDSGLCGCVFAYPPAFSLLVRMIALPPKLVLSAESAGAARSVATLGVIYSERVESPRHVAGYVVRPYHPSIGVRWPRVVSEDTLRR